MDGMTMKDLLPIPDNLEIMDDQDAPAQRTIPTMEDSPTLSHALAVADHDEKGHAQEDHQEEVKDLGWHEDEEQLANPLVGGLPNEELWLLLRRFNQQMYDVKAIARPVPGNLDLNIADEDEFSPDKLRASIARLYMTVLVGLLGAWKHIARLRSWREKRRTTAFCAAYSVAWMFDFLVPLFAATVVALIAYPPSRDLLFPPAPLALVSSKTGGVQKPQAGVLGSTDSATGAPENFKGEAVEAEANNFVNSIATVAIASASGKQTTDMEAKESGNTSDNIPDPTTIASGTGNARASAAGKEVSKKHDKTKAPMETAMWNKMRPAMHGIGDVCDTWEQFANALSPTPPFPRNTARLRLAALVVPLLAASVFISSYAFIKATSFGVGFGFFGDPAIQRGLQWLNRCYPNWQKLLELRNTALKGVPTNAQLTLTLLRIAEQNRAPLPPPPHSDQPTEDKPVKVTNEHLRAAGGDPPLNATDQELKEAIEHEPGIANQSTSSDVDAAKRKTHTSKASHMLTAVKTSIKGSIETALGADHVKAKVGSEHSKRRLGVVPSNRASQLTGPIDFKCRYHGKKGLAYISDQTTIPRISFTTVQTNAIEGSQDKDDQYLKPVWSVPVNDITELKKVGGLGWKAKLIVGWALDREIADGLEIVDRANNHYIVTAMVLRDELFNRLIAMGGQKWEAW